jgi:crotonobetainyl-CoA:carnitine CoA-transferase CaiB-like acyl-CoA transferase
MEMGDQYDGAGPLAGVRVLDLSRVLAGPLAAQILADLGADVVKVERKGAGDPSRAMGAITARDSAGAAVQSSFFDACNRNKRSLLVDFGAAADRALLRDLAAQADVLIENYIPGTLAQYELDYASLRALNPRLVYCSVTGYGQDGPRRAQPGFDPVFQAEAGIMSVTGEADGRPLKSGIYVVDEFGAFNAAVGVLAALYERATSGRGQQVDIGLFDCGVAALATVGQTYLQTGVNPGRHGNAGLSGGPSDTFECCDGPILLMGGIGDQFARICRILGVPDLANDPRFATSASRYDNRRALRERLQAETAKWTREDLLAEFAAASVPSGSVNTVADAFADTQSVARGLVVEMAAGASPKKTIANPVRLSRTPAAYRRVPPALGEGCDEVLREWLGTGEPEPEA